MEEFDRKLIEVGGQLVAAMEKQSRRDFRRLLWGTALAAALLLVGMAAFAFTSPPPSPRLGCDCAAGCPCDCAEPCPCRAQGRPCGQGGCTCVSAD